VPIQFNIDRANDLTVFTLTGEVSFQDFLSSLNQYGKEGPTLSELYDARALKGKRLTNEEIHAFAVYLSKHADKRPAGGRTAVVVSEKVDFGLSRMLSLLTEETTGYDIEVFQDIDAAFKWIDSDR
jgi:hypothetical protein